MIFGFSMDDALGCDEYVSPRGSMEYLEQDQFTSHTSTRLSFQDYTPASYGQRNASGFVSHLSVVDVIAHAGLDFARNYTR